ncbi:MAG: DNA modification methylase, partial [Planctomycetia bacterium]|nr:DNA modification methylase [Planctomycetia bacterium]
MRLPVHRWYRYSAGFSAGWAERLIAERASGNQKIRVFDPFAGSGTTLLAAQDAGVESYGVESHPFISRLARAKLARSTDSVGYRDFARTVLKAAGQRTGSVVEYPPLIRKCYRDEALA